MKESILISLRPLITKQLEDLTDVVFPNPLHLTLTYHGRIYDSSVTRKQDLIESIHELKRTTIVPSPLVGFGIQTCHFGSDLEYVSLEIKSKEIEELRRNLTKIFDIKELEYSQVWGFRPHITLGFSKNLQVLNFTEPLQVQFTDFTLHYATEEIDIPL